MQRELFARQQREKMPVERASVTHKFSVGGHEGYITVGMYDDGRPGEIFIKMSKEGSTLSGVMDGLALTVSLGLQYGVPLKVFVDKLLNTRFEHPASPRTQTSGLFRRCWITSRGGWADGLSPRII